MNRRILLLAVLIVTLMLCATAEAYVMMAEKPTAVVQDDTSVMLMLNKPASESDTSCQIYIGTSKDNATKLWGTTQDGSILVTGLKPDTTYWFACRYVYKGAFGMEQYNIRSEAVSCRTLKTVPDAVLGSLSGKGADGVTLFWSPVARAEGYYVYMGVAEDAVNIYKGYASGTSFTIDHLVSGKTYWFGIRCRRAVNGTAQKGELSNLIAYTVPDAPPAVGTPSAAAAGETGVLLTWPAAEGAEGYYVYSVSAGGAGSYLGYAAANTYTVRSLTPGAVCSFAVCSRKVINGTAFKGPLSGTVSYTVPIRPAVPVLLTAELKNRTDVTLTWSAAADAQGYYVYMGTAENDVTSYRCYAGGTSCTIAGLEQGHTYWFGIRSRKVQNGLTLKSDLSGVLSCRVPLTPPDVRLTSARADGCLTVGLEWESDDGADGYYVYMGVSADAVNIYKGYASGTSCSVGGLADGKTYWFGIRSRRVVDGETLKGELSNVMAVTATAAILAPAPATLDWDGGDGVVISWPAVPGAQGYYIYSGTSGNLSSLRYLRYSSTSPCTVTGLESGTVYWFAVVPMRKAGGNTIKGPMETASPFVILATPTGLKVTFVRFADYIAGQLVGWTTYYTLKWEEVPGAESYEVFYRKHDQEVWSGPVPVTGASVSLNALPGFDGNDCIVTVRAVCGDMTGPMAVPLVRYEGEIQEPVQPEYNTVPLSTGGVMVTGVRDDITTIPASVNNAVVTAIGPSVFVNRTNLTTLEIPGTVTSIGQMFCSGSSLTSVVIPPSVTSIGFRAFSDCADLTIYGEAGSYAETYAGINGMRFVAQ